MLVVALYAFAGTLLIVALYPYFLYPLTLKLLHNSRRVQMPNTDRSVASADLPDISIVFCAHNEGQSIARKLDNISQVIENYPGRAEALAYLDGCTDDTVDIASTHPAVASFSSKIRVIDAPRSGKSAGMNALVSHATGQLIVFTDANVDLQHDCLLVAATAFQQQDIGCICGHLSYENSNASVTASVGSFYWRFEEMLKKLESETGSTVGADGSLFAIRRSLFRPVPVDIIDDMYTSCGALLQGTRVIRVPDFRAYERHSVSRSDEFRRKIRIACRAVNCMRLIWPRINEIDGWTKYKFIGHKILRWLSIYFLAGSVLALAAALIASQEWAVMVVLASLIMAGLLLGILGLRPFHQILEILVSMTAAGIGVIESARGKRYQQWSVPQTSR